jgi:hypothetical protein
VQCAEADRKQEPKDFFTSESWHRPYTEALLETGPIELRARIAEAERAIFVRYLELYLSGFTGAESGPRAGCKRIIRTQET